MTGHTANTDVYKALCEDEFICVQMNNSNTFGRNEADKTIENTINQDSKTTSDGNHWIQCETCYYPEVGT